MYSNKSLFSLIVFSVLLLLSIFFGNLTMIFTNSIDIKAFCILFIATVVVAFYPLKFGGMSRINIFWFAIVILYLYGIVAMLIFYQIAVIFFLLAERKKKSNITLFSFYSFVFFIGPLVSYLGIEALDLFVVHPNFRQLLIANFVFYSTFLVFSSISSIVGKRFYKEEITIHKSYMLSEIGVSIFFVLLGTFLFPLVKLYGMMAILFALVIYVIAARQLRRQDTYMNQSLCLEDAIDIQGHFHNQNSNDALSQLFLQKIERLTAGDQVYLIEKSKAHYILKDKAMDKQYYPVSNMNYFEQVLAHQKPLQFKNHQQWIKEDWPLSVDAWESVALIPFKGPAQEELLIMVASTKRYAFDSTEIELCKALITSYITALHRATMMYETIYKSERCALTNLYNYRYLTEKLTHYEQQIETRQLQSISIIILDIDYFKQLNDTYGHENGNKILREFAQLLREVLGEQYLLARYGGEEFIVLLPDTSSKEALHIAERFRQNIESFEFKLDRLEDEKQQISVYITVSMGIASVPEHTTKISELITFADKALYVGAKQAGRNRVAIFQEELVH